MMNCLLKSIKIFLLVSFFALVTGCAGYNITKNGEKDGYDVYKPEPYLMITPGENGTTGKIIWLPNFNERYRIDTWNFFGKADFQFDISDGWKLTKISDKSDNTAIASKLMDIVKQSTRPETISLTGSVQLFRLVYNNGVISGMKEILVNEVDD